MRRGIVGVVAIALVPVVALQPGHLWFTLGTIAQAYETASSHPTNAAHPFVDKFTASFARKTLPLGARQDQPARVHAIDTVTLSSRNSGSAPTDEGENPHPPAKESTKARAPSKPPKLGSAPTAPAAQEAGGDVQGRPWIWGWNFYGQLGDQTMTGRAMPLQVTSLSSVIAVAGGNFHSFALKSDGSVWSWGFNSDGQLGIGSVTDKSSPAQVASLSGSRRSRRVSTTVSH